MPPSANKVTVEEASPSPPPLPKEPLPSTSETRDNSVDQPIDSLGGEEEEEEDDEEVDEDEDKQEGDEDEQEEWDPSIQRLPGQVDGPAKGKGKETETSADGEQPWQAVWSPEQNAWYFWNTQTGAVTWTNPLEPSSSTATANTSAPVQPPLPAGPPPPKQTANAAHFGAPADIDPDLAYLLPPDQRGGPSAQAGAQTALFNARTGRFTPADYAYSVDHLDEYNRAKRMNSHYFDVEAWERQKAEEHAKRKRDEETGVESSKKLTKKDMERFKKKKAEQKYRKQAWLRD